MTETTFRIIPLKDLGTLRIRCRKAPCEGVIEIPVDTLLRLDRQNAACPTCRQKLVSSADMGTDPLVDLGKALRLLMGMEDQFSIEFPVAVDRCAAER